MAFMWYSPQAPEEFASYLISCSLVIMPFLVYPHLPEALFHLFFKQLEGIGR